MPGATTRALILSTLVAAGCGSGRTSPGSEGGDRADGGPIDPGDELARMFVHTADELYRIEAPDFDLTLVGGFGLPEGAAMNDLAVTPSGTLYGITADELYSIDRQSGAATFVAAVEGAHNVAMTFLPDGSLLAADKAGGVRKVRPADGAVEELGAYGEGYGTAGDLVAVSDGTMYTIADVGPGGSQIDDNLLLTIDPDSGEVLAEVGAIGYGHVFGTAYAAGHVYAFTRDGDVVEIDRTTGHGTLVKQHAGRAFYGAGVSPLVDVE